MRRFRGVPGAIQELHGNRGPFQKYSIVLHEVSVGFRGSHGQSRGVTGGFRGIPHGVLETFQKVPRVSKAIPGVFQEFSRIFHGVSETFQRIFMDFHGFSRVFPGIYP